MKCALCGKRKSKRDCPAIPAGICPQCCGEKRVLDIDCPEVCGYLRSGREYDAQEYERMLQRMDPSVRERNRRILLQHPNGVARLEYTIARGRILSGNLADGDVLQAVTLLLEDCRTEENGIFYESVCGNLHVDALRRELRNIVHSLRSPQPEPGAGAVAASSGGLSLSAVIDCLEYVRSLSEAFQRERDSPSAYVDFLARFFPKEEARGIILAP